MAMTCTAGLTGDRRAVPGPGSALTARSKSRNSPLGAGCFEGIRNPAAHEDGLCLPEQMALEQFAAFSVLARWIDECTVEAASYRPSFRSEFRPGCLSCPACCPDERGTTAHR
jgi:hypothetical protein